MEFHYSDLDTCSADTGLVIVIDVIRAFTSAAFAIGQGAERIIPVSTVEQAIELKRRIPGSLACGEVKGLPPEVFDFGNSPTQILGLDLAGRSIVQRTSAGTQGVARSVSADLLLVASFVVASATARYVQCLTPERVTFVITGGIFDGGEEDLACAQYIEELLREHSPDSAPYIERVHNANDARVFYDPSRPEFPESDMIHCTSVDRFDFALPVTCENGMHVIRPARKSEI